MFFYVILLTLVLMLIYTRHQQMTIFKRLRIPGPKPNFMFGNSFEITREGMSKLFPKWTKQFGPIVGFYIGGRPQILVTDFELIRRIMIRDFNKFYNRNEIVPGGIHPLPKMRKMLIWSQYDEWRHLRATASSTFSIAKLRNMEPLINLSIDELVSRLNEKSKLGQEVDMTESMNEVTFSIVTKCFFGLNLSLQNQTTEVKGFLGCLRPRLDQSMLATSMILFPSLTFIAYPLRVMWETIRFYMQWSHEGMSYHFSRKFLSTRRQQPVIKSNDYLQLLIDTKRIKSKADSDLEMFFDEAKSEKLFSSDESKEGLDDDEIISNIFLLFLGGYDTNSIPLQFIIHNLTNNQGVQDKLRQDLKEMVERNNGRINLETLSEVPLLVNVIKETLRMFPPISPFTARTSNEDYEYEGILIPKGTGIFIGVTSIHQDPKYWPEPEKFKPERFENQYDKLTYLAFGAGPRNCLGMRFAYTVLQLVVANLVLKYKFEPGPSTEVNIETHESHVNLSPKNGVFCKILKLVA